MISACCLGLSVTGSAAEVWAPGVSTAGGWVDYNKAVVNDGVWADTGMCWAASASNVLSWWYKQQNKTNTVGDPWYVYRAVYGNVGSTPSYALNWWINGVTNSWGDVTTPTGYDVDGWATVEGKENGEWPYGAFLSSDYDTSLHPIDVASNANDSDGRSLTFGILDALASGYALSLSVYSEAGNFQVAHAITLWGAEYTGEGDNRHITKMWITDSDDGVEQLVEYSVSSKDAGVALSNGTLSGSLIRYAAGMQVDVVPEPATATLSLLALAALASVRRRK